MRPAVPCGYRQSLQKQVPPHRGPKEGNNDHAKSRIAQGIRGDDAMPTSPRTRRPGKCPSCSALRGQPIGRRWQHGQCPQSPLGAPSQPSTSHRLTSTRRACQADLQKGPHCDRLHGQRRVQADQRSACFGSGMLRFGVLLELLFTPNSRACAQPSPYRYAVLIRCGRRPTQS
jgi:hypothetical protein